MTMIYSVEKEKGTTRYRILKNGCPMKETYKDKKKALKAAAELEGLTLKDYMRYRKS